MNHREENQPDNEVSTVVDKTKEEHKYIPFTGEEKFNIIFYILGIMFFKFGFETLGQVSFCAFVTTIFKSMPRNLYTFKIPQLTINNFPIRSCSFFLSFFFI